MKLSADAWATRVGETRKHPPGVLERVELAVLTQVCREEAAQWDYPVR
jgi:hypothetical protein